jgi:hypothetical protein
VVFWLYGGADELAALGFAVRWRPSFPARDGVAIFADYYPAAGKP